MWSLGPAPNEVLASDVDVVGNASLLVVTLNLHYESDFGAGRILYNNIHRKKRLHPDIETITHQLELTIRRNKSHQSLVLETTQSDALMELDIVELDGFVTSGSALGLVVGLIVESQLEVRHS